jgi:hypothetical protein
MSAYIEPQAHIAAIVRAAWRGPHTERPVSPDSVWHGVRWDDPAGGTNGARWIDHENIGRVADMLTAANVASVSYRYSDDKPDELPGPRPCYWLEPIDWHAAVNAAPVLAPVAVLKAIDGYEYQSCEHPGWRTSEAYDFCDSLRRAIIDHLPGYDAAAWEIDDETPAQVVGWTA